MIELLVVLSIIGIAAGIAIPSLGSAARTFRSRDQAQELLSAVRAARSLSQKRNEPVLLKSAPGALNLFSPSYVGATDGYLIAVDTANWTLTRTINLPDVKISSFPSDGFAFCPSGEARFRKDSLDGDALCGLGDLVAPGATITFEVLDVVYEIPVNSALASASLRRGS
jgi:type II secretory pathway pseudopilin PulG